MDSAELIEPIEMAAGREESTMRLFSRVRLHLRELVRSANGSYNQLITILFAFAPDVGCAPVRFPYLELRFAACFAWSSVAQR